MHETTAINQEIKPTFTNLKLFKRLSRFAAATCLGMGIAGTTSYLLDSDPLSTMNEHIAFFDLGLMIGAGTLLVEAIAPKHEDDDNYPDGGQPLSVIPNNVISLPLPAVASGDTAQQRAA